jgi:hypothetical protein
MLFHKFNPRHDTETRERYLRDKKFVHTYNPDGSLLTQILVEDAFVKSHRPFYRLYPGIITPLTRIGIEKVRVEDVRLPVNGLSLEFPKEYPLQLIFPLDNKDITFTLLALGIVTYNEHWRIFLQTDSDDVSLNFPSKGTIEEYLKDHPVPVLQRTTRTLFQIVLGVCLLPTDDSSLVQPIVLRKDAAKYNASGDEKFIEKARRRGLVGWDIGKDIPTPEEIEEMRANHERGMITPHFRMGHFAIRYKGPGGMFPEVTWVRETFVNKDLIHKVPQGYYDDKPLNGTRKNNDGH